MHLRCLKSTISTLRCLVLEVEELLGDRGGEGAAAGHDDADPSICTYAHVAVLDEELTGDLR